MLWQEKINFPDNGDNWFEQLLIKIKQHNMIFIFTLAIKKRVLQLWTKISLHFILVVSIRFSKFCVEPIMMMFFLLSN